MVMAIQQYVSVLIKEVLCTILFGLVRFYGISNIIGYFMPNPLYSFILKIYDLVCLGFMAYQTL